MIKRTLLPHLLRLAKQYPVVTITGPRQSGKTTLCKQAFPDMDYVNLENPETRIMVQGDYNAFFNKYSTGVIIDEVQRLPELVSFLQVHVDENPKPGRFILTGSQQFELMNTLQSLAGRTALLQLLPFSYQELYGKKKSKKIEEILYEGFYPRIHDMKLQPTEALSFYSQTYIERDVRQLVNVTNLSQFETFVRLCAGQVGQVLNYTRLANDVGIDQKTAKKWISVLETSFILYQLKPHHENYRKRLTKLPKLYFYDVGLLSYFLGIREPRQLESHPLRGFIFENFVISEVVKGQAHQVQDHQLTFFRDQKGNEVDLLIEDGISVTPIEIKSSQTFSNSFLKGLHYYQELREKSGKSTNHPYLIYAGEKEHEYKGVSIKTFSHINDIIKKGKLEGKKKEEGV